MDENENKQKASERCCQQSDEESEERLIKNDGNDVEGSDAFLLYKQSGDGLMFEKGQIKNYTHNGFVWRFYTEAETLELYEAMKEYYGACEHQGKCSVEEPNQYNENETVDNGEQQ